MRTALERRGAGLITLGLVVVAGVMGAAQVGANGFWVLLLLVVIGYEFQKRLDQGLPLMQIAALLAVIQWMVGPVLAFGSDLPLARYIMYVDEPTYFSYALPGTAAFVFGLLAVGSSVRQRQLLRFLSRENFLTIGLILNAIAWVARSGVLASFGVPAFFLHLVSQVGYVGVLYFLFSPNPYRWPLIALGIFPLLSTSAEAAMFHDLLLWSALLFCYWYGLRKRSAVGKTLLLTGVVAFVVTIQAIKADYRSQIRMGEEPSLVEEAREFWSGRDDITRESLAATMIIRLNQGWIISAVLSNVPANEPYAGGETVYEAVVAALVPRFLMPDKAEAGGQENFRRFTGLGLAPSTSMGISPLGEAYANFGHSGGIILMLLFGLSLSGFYALCLRWVVRHPDFLFWVPLIFYQAIKAETEFAVVWNQMTKGAIVAFGLYWLMVRTLIPFLFPTRVRPARNPRRATRLPPDSRGSRTQQGANASVPGDA